MNGKVLVVTGALGALGRVVVDTALARGARVAGIDHAKAQSAATAARIETRRRRPLRCRTGESSDRCGSETFRQA